MLHRHHIIPKHFCQDKSCTGYKTKRKHTCFIGHSSNLSEPLTILKHAERHKELWAIYGRHEDFIAWKLLTGQIDKEQGRLLAMKIGNARPESKANRIAAQNRPEVKARTMVGWRKGNPLFGSIKRPKSSCIKCHGEFRTKNIKHHFDARCRG